MFQHIEWEILLNQLPDIYRQLSFYGSFYRTNDRSMHYSTFQDNELVWEETQMNEHQKVLFSKLRSKRPGHYWEDIGVFESGNTSSFQVNMEAELNNKVLIIALPNPHDHQSDIIFLHFDKSLKHFLPSKENQLFTTEQKAIIGNMVFQHLSQQLQLINQFKKSFTPIQKSFAKAEQNLTEVKENNEALIKQQRDYIRLLCFEWLRREGERYNVVFKLSEEAIQSLLEAGIGLSMMESVLNNAAATAFTVHPNEELLTIYAHHLEWDNDPVVVPVKHLPKKDKTIELLDRYESAAIQLSQTGEKITGKNIAAQLIPAISPPAITDAVKKHRKPIQFLLDRYPNRWSLIRENLSPIKKIEEILKRKAV